MSWQATTWAVNQQIVENAAARHVLLCLANYAGKDGCDAFPAVSTLMRETGLSKRTVQGKLIELQELGAIKLGNQAMVAAKIARPDRRPINYDLCMDAQEPDDLRDAGNAPREDTGGNSRPNGGHLTPERGAGVAPELSLEPSREQEPKSDLSEALEAYLKTATLRDLPKVVKLTDKRKGHLAARLKEYGLDVWKEAMERAGRSPFLCGHNDRKWKADLDFMLRPDSVAKILEGKYDGKGAMPPAAPIDGSIEATWRRRLANWVSTDVWNPEWGNPPGTRGCEAPKDLAELAIRHKQNGQ